MEFGVWSLEFGIWNLECGVWSLGKFWVGRSVGLEEVPGWGKFEEFQGDSKRQGNAVCRRIAIGTARIGIFVYRFIQGGVIRSLLTFR